MFKETIALCNQLSNTTKKNEKKEILKSATPEDIKLLQVVYDQFTTFGVTSKTCLKHGKAQGELYSFNDLIDKLVNRTLSGHDALEACNLFANSLPEGESEFFYRIIDRDLKIGTGIRIINGVLPGTIKTFNVALAERYDKAILKKKSAPNFDEESWVMLRKLDGIRCIIKVENNEATAWSRQGKQINVIDNILRSIEKFNTSISPKLDNYVLDGELCMVDDKGDEDFQGILKLCRRKDYTIENPKFVMFDYMPLDTFLNAEDTTTEPVDYINRLCNLNEYYDLMDLTEGQKYFSVVENLGVANSELQINNKLSEVVSLKWEGLILRKVDSFYLGKRSWDLLKVKKFYDAEYIVEHVAKDNQQITIWRFGDKTYIDKGSLSKHDQKLAIGETVNLPVMSSAYVNHRGNTVRVGSGFSNKERIGIAMAEFDIDYEKEYGLKFEDADVKSLRNKVIQVKYFEETLSQLGEYSLRFPTCGAIYEGDNGRDF
jgi:DNA ligase 1